MKYSFSESEKKEPVKSIDKPVKSKEKRYITLQKSRKNSQLNKNKSCPLKLMQKDELTIREEEILDALVLGLSNKQIGEKLFLSVNTIKTHVLNLYEKLNVHNRTQAAIKGSDFKAKNGN